MITSFNQINGVDKDRQTIKAVIEIPAGSINKVEWDRRRGYFVLDRVEPAIFAKPANYGFIPQTLDEDGDELDVLLVTTEPLACGVVVPAAKVIGLLRFVDDDEKDDKIIAVPADDTHTGRSPDSVADLGPGWRAQIEHHFRHYKDLKKPGSTIVKGFGDATEAWQVILDCHRRAQADRWW